MVHLIDVLQEFVMGLLLAALPILAAYAIKALKAWGDKLLADLENNKPSLHWALEEAVEIAVRAAEKMEFSKFIDDKKAYAFEIVQLYLDNEGWEEIDVELIEAAIEAEVLKQFPKD